MKNEIVIHNETDLQKARKISQCKYDILTISLFLLSLSGNIDGGNRYGTDISKFQNG